MILIIFLDQFSKFLVLNIMLNSFAEINILPFSEISLNEDGSFKTIPEGGTLEEKCFPFFAE